MVQPDGSYRYEDYGITPEQYHAGLDKLWTALGLVGAQEKDVFTLAAEAIRERDKLAVANQYLLAAFANLNLAIPPSWRQLPEPVPPMPPWPPGTADPVPFQNPYIWVGDRYVQ